METVVSVKVALTLLIYSHILNEKMRESGWKKIKEILVDLKVHPHEVEFLTKDKNLAVISKKLAEMF